MGKTIRPRLSRKLLALLAMGVFAAVLVAGTAFALGAFNAPYAYDDPLAGSVPSEPLEEAYSGQGSVESLGVAGDAGDLSRALDPQASTISVTFKNSNGSTIQTISETVGSTWRFPSNPTPASGKYFSGWYTAAEGGVRVNAPQTVEATSPTTLYAQYGTGQEFYLIPSDEDGDGTRELLTFTTDRTALAGLNIHVKNDGKYYNKSEAAVTGLSTSDIDYWVGNTGTAYSSNSSMYPPWIKTGWAEVNKASTVRFDVSFKSAQPVSVALWFDQFINLERFENLEYFDTSRSRDFSLTFGAFNKYTDLDLSMLDTSAAENMYATFFIQSGTKSINISGWNMTGVTNAADMFRGYDAVHPPIESINMSGVKCTAATNLRQMFWCCDKIKVIDLSGFDFSKVTDATSMFNGCSSLETIITAKGASLASANCTNTFKGCNNLYGLAIASNGTRYTTYFKNKNDAGKTYAKTRTTSQEGYFTPADENTSHTITYHYNADGLDLSSSATTAIHALSRTYPTIANPLWPRTGFKATSWNTRADGTGTTYEFGQQMTADLTENLELYLQWKPNAYSITFDANGGTGEAPAQTGVAYDGGTVTMPGEDVIHRDGYTLLGWALSPSVSTQTWTPGQACTKLTDIDGDELHAYAVWRANTYRVTFDGNRANGGPASWSQTNNATYDGAYTLPSSNPTPQSGYYFSGWYTAPVGGTRLSSTTKVQITQDTTMYAQYGVAQDFYVIVDDTDGDGYRDKMTFATDPAMVAGLKSNTDIFNRDHHINDSNVQDIDYYIGNAGVDYVLEGSNWNKTVPWWKENGGQADGTYNTKTMINKIRTVAFDQSFKDVTPKSLSLWFDQFRATTTFENPEYLNTSRTENFEFAFAVMTSLKSIDFSSFDMSAAKDVRRVFWNNSATSINISGWNLESATDCTDMFRDCTKLTDLNMTGVKASKVANAFQMFMNCKQLVMVDLSGFNLSGVTEAGSMFSGCSKLQTIICADGTNMQSAASTSMYAGCTSLVGKCYSSTGAIAGRRAFDSAQITTTYSKACTTRNDGYLTPATKFSSYGVRYHINDGAAIDTTTSTSAMVQSAIGKYASVSGPLWTREGFHATGWNTTPDGSGTAFAFGDAFNAETEPAANTTLDLYLQWASNTYNVRFEANGGTGSASDVTGIAYETGTVTMPNDGFERDGYDLAGWALTPTATTPTWQKGASATKLTYVNDDTITLYAVWSGPKSYTITFDANTENGGSSITATDGFTKLSNTQLSKSERFGDNYVLPNDPTPQSGYYFSGWYTKPVDGIRVSPNVANSQTENTTLYAQYGKDENYYVVFTDENGNRGKQVMTFTKDPSMVAGKNKGWIGDGQSADVIDYLEMSTGYLGHTSKTVPWIEGHSGPSGEKNDLWGLLVNNTKKVVFDVSFKDVQVRDISFFFDQFKNLESFENLEYFDTSRAVNWDLTFGAFNKFKNLDLSMLDTSAAESMKATFFIERGVETINISGWNLTNVKSLDSMFRGYGDPKYGEERWSTVRSINMTGVKCSAVTNTFQMFMDCKYLTELDLSGFDFSHVTNAEKMFSDCSNLKTILCSDTNSSFSSLPVSKSANMFVGCTSLKGTYYSASTSVSKAFDSAYVNNTYAKAKTLKQDGYLTPLSRYNSYEVVYHLNGEGIDATSTVSSPIHEMTGSYAMTANALWVNPGFKPVSWNTKPDGSGTKFDFGQSFSATNEPKADEKLDLYLQWKPNSYVLTLDANGGSGSVNSKEYGYNNSESHGFTSDIVLPVWSKNGIYRDGYELLGWSVMKNATQPDPGFGAGATVNRLTRVDGDVITLYAVWNKLSYTATIDLNGADGAWTAPEGFTEVSGQAGVWSKASIPFDSTVSLPSPTRTGYNFNGWKVADAAGTAVGTTVASSGNPRELKMGSGAATASATWTVTPPEAMGSLTYNSTRQTIMGVAPGHTIVSVAPSGATTSTSGYGVYEDGVDAGKAYATDAGTYAITVALSEEAKAAGATWDDGTTSDKVIDATIDRLSVGEAQIGVSDVTFTGFEQRPKPTVTFQVAGETVTLQEGVDYTLAWSNNVHAADKSAAAAPTVTVTALPTSNVAYGNTQGEQSATFSIAKRSLAEPGAGAQVTFAEIPDQTYTGAALQPALTVSLASAAGTYTLPATDFESSWSTNVDVTNAAQATATAAATGDFTGAATTTFKIVPADISRATVTLNSASATYDFEGDDLTLPANIAVASATLDYNGDNVAEALVGDRDFTAALAAADGSAISAVSAPGSYNVALTGTGNFSGVALAPFSVVPKHYQVTFDAHGGSFAGASSMELEQVWNAAYALPATDPTLGGFTFAGWWTKDGSSDADPQGEAASADWGERVTAETLVPKIAGGTATLYARWSRDSFAATFSADHGATLTGTEGILDAGGTAQVAYDGAVPAGIRVDAGSLTFLGWTYRMEAPDGSVRTGTVADYTTVKVTGTATFTARLVETTFVAATATDGLVGVGAEAKATAASASAESLATVEGQRIAYAPADENYELSSVTVTDLAAPGEQAHSATVTPGATSFDLGGKTYACSWATAGDDAGALTLGAPGEANMSLTVSFAYSRKTTTFQVMVYKQNVSLDADLSTYEADASMTYTSGTVDAGSKIEVTPAPSEGFTFSQAVIENPATTDAGAARFDGTTIVDLYYTRDTYAYTVTYKDGSGATLAPATSGTAAYGATLGLKGTTPAPKVALEAPTVAGFGPATATTITIGADEKSNVLSATYAEAAYAVTVDPNGGTWTQDGFTRQTDGTYKRNADLAYRSTQTLAAPTRAGYAFAGWVASGASVAVSGDTLTQGTEASVVTATWTVAPPASTTRTYDGTAQVVVAAGEGYELAIAPAAGSTGKADGASVTSSGALVTHAGTYEVTATLRAGDRNVTWADGTTAPKVVRATVERATNSWTASPACASVTYGTALSPSATPRFPLGGATVTWDYAATAAGPFSTDAPTEVGTYVARATVEATDDYAGLTGTAPFAIGQLALADANVDAIAEQGYTGSAVTPPVTVRDGARVLANGTDYTVTYESNVDVGTNTAVAIVEGRGNYAGTVRKPFSIGRAPIAKPTATALTYNGSAQVGVAVATGFTLEVTEAPAAATGYGVYWLDGTEIGSAYFTTAGTYTVVATPDANHRWDDGTINPVTLFVTVAPFDISGGSLAEVAPLTYTGEAQQPAPALLVDYTGDLVDDQVNEGRDYSLSWSGNTNAGDATVTATGTGNFTGSVSRTFRIEPLPVTLRATSDETGKVYDKVAGEPTFTVSVDGGSTEVSEAASEALAPTVTRTDAAGTPTTSQQVGTYVMKIGYTPNANYDVRTEDGTYTISKRPLTVTVNDIAKTFGDATPSITGTVTGAYASGDSASAIGLAYASDAKEDAGTYEGSLVATWTDDNYDVTVVPGTLTINPRAISDAKISASADGTKQGDAYVYAFSGERIQPAVSATIDSTVVGPQLYEGEFDDFTVQILDSGGTAVDGITAAGTYTARLTGTGSLTGTRNLTLRVDNVTPTVTFDANGGSLSGGATTQAVTQEYTAAWSLPTAPTRTYTKGGQTFTYTFAGWWTKNGSASDDWGEAVTAGAACPYIADVTLYAKWETDREKKAYHVNHYVQELDATGAPVWPAAPTATDDSTGLAGDDATYVQRTVEGHTFDANLTTYADSAHATAQAEPLYVAEDGSTVVSLYYTLDSFEVTWTNDDATHATTRAYFGSTAATPATTPTRAPGRDYTYDFARWADESGNDYNNPDLPVKSPVTYHAEYTATPRTYTVKIDANGGELAPGQAAEKSLAFAATLDLPDPTCARGWAFDGWAVERVGDEGDVGTLTPGSGTTTYTGGTADVKISAKWRIPIPVAASGLAYNASERQVLAASAGVRLNSITAAVGSDNEGSRIDEYGNAVATHAGDYSVTAEISASALGVDESLLSWADGSTDAKSVAATIKRAANQVTGLGTDPVDPVYGDSFSGTANATWGAGTISYAWGRTADGTFGASKPTPAGTWYVRATVPEGDDWEAAEATAAFRILPATIENASVTSVPATYNGFSQEPSVTVTVGGGKTLVVGRDYVLEYYADEALTNPVEVSDMVAAGTYWVKAVGVGNYATQGEGEEPESFKAGTYQIMPAELTLSAQALASRPYDATTDATAQLDRTTLALSGAVAGEAPTLDASAATAALDSPNVGERTATVTGVALAAGNPANANYRIAAGEGGAQATAQATVTPALLTVSGISATARPYDGTATVEVTGTPQIASGVVAGQGVTIDATAPLSATLADPSAGAARTATVFGLTLADDAGAANVNRNYAFAETTLPVDIACAKLTVSSVSVADKTYDGTKTAVADLASITFEGAVSGESPSLDASALKAEFSAPGVAPSVPVTVSGLVLDASDPTNANYELTAATASTAAAIAPAELVVRPHASTAAYGSDPVCEGYDLEGFVAGEDRASAGVSGEPTFAFTCTAGSPAGDYVVTAQVDLLSAPNYYFTGAQAEFRVVPADITWDPPVGVSPARPVYGDVYTAVGTPSFGEATFVFSSTPTFSPTSTSATPPTTVGTYYVRGTVAGSANWNAGQQVASFTIAPATFDEATVVVEPLTYTGEALQPQVSVRIGTQPPLSADTDYTLTFFADAAGAKKIDPATDVVDAGTYYVQATGRNNYDGTATAIQPFTVDQADSMAVGLAGYAGTYDGAAHALSADVTGVDARSSAFTMVEYQVGEGVWSTDAPSFTATTDGDVAVRARATNPNYKTHTSADATVRIDRAAVTVVADGKSKVFGQEDPDLTATVTGLVGADSVDYELTRDAGEDVGTYVIHATGERLQGSYEVTLTDGTLTVDFAVARIPSAVEGLVYDGKPQLGVDLDALCVAEGERATDAGEHVATVRLADPSNCVWGDPSVDPAGPVVVTYAIAPADIAQARIAPIADQVETGEPIEPALDVTALGRALVPGVDYEAAYESNVGVGTATVTVAGTGNWTGTASATFKVVPDRPDGVPMFRLYNPNSGEHFYTGSVGEREFLSRVGWSYEGVGWWAPAEGGEPVYRLYNPNAGDHHYTLSAEERDALVAVGWNYEGVGWRSAGDVSVLRQYNPNAASGAHNFTTSRAENDALVRAGWNFEGVGWMAVMAG